jgi:hypothetical protein
MVADFRDAFNKTLDIIADSNGGLVEHREDEGVVAEWNPAILNAKTHLLNPRHWVRPDRGRLLDTLRNLSPYFRGHSVRLRLALVKFAADVGEVGRKLLPRAPFAEDRLRIPENRRIIMDCADKNPRESLLNILLRR